MMTTTKIDLRMSKVYHKSIMLDQCIEGLNILKDGIYVDLTFGGGGHSRAILNHLSEKGRLIGFDQDKNALANSIDDTRFSLIRENFKNAASYLMALGIDEIDGVLVDLGVSSFQLDNDDSGFSYRQNLNLDMRMDDRTLLKANDILNNYSQKDLIRIFQEYGEVRNTKTLVNEILEVRKNINFSKTNEFNDIINKVRIGKFQTYAAPIYQALRIEVNQEFEVLKQMLKSIVDVIKINGIIAIITFHSLEDKIVKTFMKYGRFDSNIDVDIFGNSKSWNWVPKNKKPILASISEIEENSRSRSAKLRIYQKINDKI